MAAAGPGPGAGGAVKTLALVLEDEARRGGGGGYCSGDTVSGQVLLELAGPLPLRGLRLEAAGRARVAWSESPGAVPGAGTWGVAVRAPGPGPRREAEVRYLDIRQSLLRDPPEGERGAGPALPQPRRCGSRAAGRQRGGGGAGTLRVGAAAGSEGTGTAAGGGAPAGQRCRVPAEDRCLIAIPSVGADKRRAGPE
nr:arrestin domain-containing protein 4-like [Taeniopygia guttata]